MSQHQTVISNKLSVARRLRELVEYKDLLWVLAKRDFKIKYAQTFLGVFWSFIRPIILIGIFSFVFGTVVKVDTGGIPYIIFVFTGISGWTFFSAVLGGASASLRGSSAMIKKVYFPRLVIPLSKAMVALIDFGIVLALLLAYLFIEGHSFTTNVLYFPLFVLANILVGLTFGIWISALTIRYRDLQQIVPFVLQVGMYATPVAYPARLVPEKYLDLYYMVNPMVGIIEGFRWSLLGYGELEPVSFVSIGLIAVLFVLGVLFFFRVERIMPDIL